MIRSPDLYWKPRASERNGSVGGRRQASDAYDGFFATTKFCHRHHIFVTVLFYWKTFDIVGIIH